MYDVIQTWVDFNGYIQLPPTLCVLLCISRGGPNDSINNHQKHLQAPVGQPAVTVDCGRVDRHVERYYIWLWHLCLLLVFASRLTYIRYVSVARAT
jgi:hypothetical protein